MTASRRWAALLVFAVACGGDHHAGSSDGGSDVTGDAMVDAYVNPCAFNPPSAPTGSGVVEFGTGEMQFTPVGSGSDLQVYYGPQGAYYVWFNGRFQNLDPGGSDELTRPQTKFSIFEQDGTRINLETCGYRLAYQGSDDGWMYLSTSWLSMLLPSVGPGIDMTPLHMQLEVLDHEGNYALDNRLVNALAAIPASP